MSHHTAMAGVAGSSASSPRRAAGQRVRSWASLLLAVNPVPRRWPTALAAAISIATPIIAGTSTGHEKWGIIAASGGFLSIYMADRTRHERLREMPAVALTMLVCAAIGVAASGSMLLAIGGTWIVAVLASGVSAHLRVGVPGAVIPVLIAGMAGRAAAPTSTGGIGESPVTVLTLVAAGLLLAYVVVAAPIPFAGRNGGRPIPRRTPSSRAKPLDLKELVVVRRLWLAASLACAILLVRPQAQSYWVFLTLVAVLQAVHVRRVTVVRGIHRIIGTFAGVGLFVLITSFEMNGIGTALTVAALQFMVELVAVRHYGLGLVFVTPAALVLISALPGTDPGQFLVWRLQDTVIGAVIAIVVVLAEAAFVRARPRARPADSSPFEDHGI